LLEALDVFFLSSAGGLAARRLSDKDRASLHKIARCFNVEAATLVAQTEEHLTIAEHEMRLDPSLTCLGAWAKALARTQKAPKTRKTYQVDVLRPMLQFYAIATGSTSGIERDFGSAKRNLGEQWNGMPVAEERRMLLMVTRSTTPVEARARVVTAARLVWAGAFGVPRDHRSGKRLGKRPCFRRGDSEQPKTHSVWLRNRRAAVSAAPPAADALPDHALQAMAESMWTEKQTLEVARQHRVRTTRKLQAAVEGLDVDMAPDLAQVTAERAATARRQRALESLHRRSAAIRSLPAPSDIQGKTVWVDPDAEAIMKESNSAWWVPKSLRVVDRRELAHVLIVRDAAKPGGRNQAVAHLRGCLVTTPEHFLSPPGTALQWKAALHVPRVVFLSDAVRAAHTCMVDLILATARALQLPNGKEASRWRTFVGAAEWEDFQVLAARRRKHETRTVLHAAERGDPTFQDAPSVMSLQEFLESLGQLEASTSILGMCNR
jgi:hypothetical protein